MITNVDLYQTIPVGQTWAFPIQNGYKYKARSNSEYFLYQFTNDTLVIIAREKLPANVGNNELPTITIADDSGEDVMSYTLHKSYSENQVTGTTIYFGGSATVPNEINPLQSNSKVITGNSGSVTFIGNNYVVWIALPTGWTLTNIVDTMGGSYLSNYQRSKVIGDYTLYYDESVAIDTSRLKYMFSKS